MPAYEIRKEDGFRFCALELVLSVDVRRKDSGSCQNRMSVADGTGKADLDDKSDCLRTGVMRHAHCLSLLAPNAWGSAAWGPGLAEDRRGGAGSSRLSCATPDERHVSFSHGPGQTSKMRSDAHRLERRSPDHRATKENQIKAKILSH
jgi:hypothetical protein